MNWKRFALSLFIASFLHHAALTHAQDASQKTLRSGAAQNASQFGQKGRNLLAGSVDGHWTAQPHGRDDWALSVQPSLAHFVRDSIAVGLMPGYVAGSEPVANIRGVRFQELSLSFFALWQVPLADKLSWLVIPSFGYAYHWRESDIEQRFASLKGPSNVTSFIGRHQHALRASVQLPFVYHLGAHVVAGGGPYLQFDWTHRDSTLVVDDPPTGAQSTSPFARSDKSFTLGVSSFIGATF